MSEWLYGRHSVEEALRAGRRKVFRVLLSKESRGQERGDPHYRFGEIENLARGRGVPIERVDDARIGQLTRVGNHHQGVAAEVSPFPYGSMRDAISICRAAGPAALALVLDSVQDPQNFGTLLRTAEATGVSVVLMLDRRQVDVTPAASKASAGAVEHLIVCLVNNLSRGVEELQEAGLWVYALQSEAGARNYTIADLSGPLGLVVGSEGHGISRLVRERCDGALALPMKGRVESLNAAVAGSIALYEVLRQREAEEPPDRPTG